MNRVARESFVRLHRLVDKLFFAQTSLDRGVYPSGVISDDLARHALPEHQFDTLTFSQNQLVSIPYHQFYSREFQAIESELDFLLTQDLEEGLLVFIRLVKQTCKTNDWSQLERQWLEHIHLTDRYVWSFGPVEALSDHLFHSKRFFTALLLEKDFDKERIVDTILQEVSAFHRALPVSGSITPAKTHFLLGNIVSWGGELEHEVVVGWSRPESTDLLRQYGTVKQVFLNILQKKIDEIYVPIAKIIFTGQQQERAVRFLQSSLYIGIFLHELCHTIGKFEGYRDRLGDCYPTLEETRTDFTAYLFARYLEDKGILSKGFAADMVLGYFAVHLHMLLVYQQTGRRLPYANTCFYFFGVLQDILGVTGEGIITFFDESEVQKRMEKAAVELLRLAKEEEKSAVRQVFLPNLTALSLVDILKEKGIVVDPIF